MKTITVHSFRRGAGKSSLAANIAALVAADGHRAALIDTDFQAPSLHLFFGLPESEISHTLNDYLWEKCEITQAAYDVTSRLDAQLQGKVILIPASTSVSEIMRMLRSAYDFDKLNDGLQKLVEAFQLDVLVLDTMAGLNEDTLLSIAVANTLVVLLHPDQQDYQGTAVTVEIARNLQVPSLYLVLNDAPGTLDIDHARAQLEQTYPCDAAVVLPHSEKLMALASSKIFALHYPNDPLTAQISELVERMIA